MRQSGARPQHALAVLESTSESYSQPVQAKRDDKLRDGARRADLTSSRRNKDSGGRHAGKKYDKEDLAKRIERLDEQIKVLEEE